MAEDAAMPLPVLIVVGSTLRAEEADRPLGYFLKQQIESAPDVGAFRALVVADFRWLHDEGLQRLPTISLGGPGVNELSHRWLEELPLALAVDGQYYVQMDPDLEKLRVSLWGMDNATTQVAVSAFLQRYLAPFLEHCREALTELGEDLDEDR